MGPAGTFNSRNALSVQFSRIRTSTSLVIFHSCSATSPLMSLMPFLILIREREDERQTTKAKRGRRAGLGGKVETLATRCRLFEVRQIVRLFYTFAFVISPLSRALFVTLSTITSRIGWVMIERRDRRTEIRNAGKYREKW